jgi:flagellar biosynthesis protein FlhG
MSNPTSSSSQFARAKRISIIGAKGGVGKTLVATNLAIYLATLGKRVVVVDADETGGNAQTLLGLGSSALHALDARPSSAPSYGDGERHAGRANDDAVGLASGVSSGQDAAHEAPSPRDEVGFGTLVDTKIAGVQLLHTLLDEPLGAVARSTRRSALRRLVPSLVADYVIVDVGAGTDPQQLDLFLQGDVRLVVTVGEPTALESGYRMLRSAYARALQSRMQSPADRARFAKVMGQWVTPPSPRELIATLHSEGDAMAGDAEQVLQEFFAQLVVNQVRVRPDLDLGDAVRTVVRRKLGLRLQYAGSIDFDDAVWSSVRARRPLMVETPGSKASKCLEKIARRLLAGEHRLSSPTSTSVSTSVSTSAPVDSYHDLLEIHRGSTEEEIRKAFKQKKEIFASDSFVTHGLMHAGELEAVQRQLREAYDVLMDPLRRKAYELSVFPADQAEDDVDGGQARARENLPPAPAVGPDTEFTGAMLRAVRESQGLELKEISKRTKIGVAYLQSLEEEDFQRLPESVYVRGFVTEFARCVDLDPSHVARTYMRRVKQVREGGKT